jgi:hypothetical protein
MDAGSHITEHTSAMRILLLQLLLAFSWRLFLRTCIFPSTSLFVTRRPGHGLMLFKFFSEVELGFRAYTAFGKVLFPAN